MYMGTYNRLDVHIFASNLEVIKRLSKKFRPECRFSREHKEGRKQAYRDILKCHEAARNLAREFRL